MIASVFNRREGRLNEHHQTCSYQIAYRGSFAPLDALGYRPGTNTADGIRFWKCRIVAASVRATAEHAAGGAQAIA
jgi:hypothetical protein